MPGLRHLLPTGLGGAGTIPFPDAAVGFCMAEPEHLSGSGSSLPKTQGMLFRAPRFLLLLSEPLQSWGPGLQRAGTGPAAAVLSWDARAR